MSFGTGHHATTMLMMEEMSRIDFKGKSVIDFGSGTGVLAILAKKLGAGKTEAIDYDSWCIENAAENFNSNNTPEIVLTQSDKMGTNIGLADVILANINLNIIRDNLDLISNACLPGAEMLFSGVLISDKEVITGEISKYEMKVIATSKREGWLLVRAKKV
jgi:ribosomal protein L11 methyltransferase